MRLHIVTPPDLGVPTGNRVTARRWARLLRDLGHRTTVGDHENTPPCDVLVALHAVKCAGAVHRFRRTCPDRPVVVALTGTDIYGTMQRDPAARRALRAAHRLVALQPEALSALPEPLRRKAVAIRQSAVPVPTRRPVRGSFRVCVIAHLRPVKDPLRTAYAARRLPEGSRVEVVHVGAATTLASRRRAEAEVRRNPRYRWLGARSHGQTRRILAGSHLLVLSSRSEGGANVIAEAAVSSIPVVSSHIPGSIGMLGRSYPGYFPHGDTLALAGLLARAEGDEVFYHRLRRATARRAPLFQPERERDAWARVLASLPHRAS